MVPCQPGDGCSMSVLCQGYSPDCVPTWSSAIQHLFQARPPCLLPAHPALGILRQLPALFALFPPGTFLLAGGVLPTVRRARREAVNPSEMAAGYKRHLCLVPLMML